MRPDPHQGLETLVRSHLERRLGVIEDGKTWDGVLELVCARYPAVRAKVVACAASLRSAPFASIEARAATGFLRGASYFDINEAAVAGASDDERYVTTSARLADLLQRLEPGDDTWTLPRLDRYEQALRLEWQTAHRDQGRELRARADYHTGSSLKD